RTCRRPLAHVCAVYTRRYRLVDSAMEVFLRRGTKRGLFLDFGVTKGDVDRRNEFVRMLVRFCPRGTLKHWPTEARRLQRLWQGRRISNFDYLMGLNALAGRSYSDLCQYPVFPWVLSCYGAPALDLGDPACYRDLSRPIGALDDARLAEFLERYESFQDPDIPAFMYGSHYSTAVGVVLHFLLRLQPFADLHQSMQNGAFDVPDRLFSSVPRAWALCTSALSEVKELTPEWYCVPDFLRNVNGFELGATQDGERVDDVALPRWAASPEDFIRKHRAALESEHVSENLHHWIDLIFGHKQQGQAAVDAHNVFYYLTYYGAIDLTKIRDDALRRATELQIAHFGQCPMQLFSRPHPPRGRRVLVPRPLATTTQGLDLWRQVRCAVGRAMHS
ncbi:BEACH domain-containing protein, partial [Tribonema minus]